MLLIYQQMKTCLENAMTIRNTLNGILHAQDKHLESFPVIKEGRVINNYLYRAKWGITDHLRHNVLVCTDYLCEKFNIFGLL